MAGTDVRVTHSDWQDPGEESPKNFRQPKNRMSSDLVDLLLIVNTSVCPAKHHVPLSLNRLCRRQKPTLCNSTAFISSSPSQ
ncbi:hypothetical protein INR49_032215 [Caranx melampygus]|nr:hypothetical protein INR49_032215 [Caranx melampygus]